MHSVQISSAIREIAPSAGHMKPLKAYIEKIRTRQCDSVSCSTSPTAVPESPRDSALVGLRLVTVASPVYAGARPLVEGFWTKSKRGRDEGVAAGDQTRR